MVAPPQSPKSKPKLGDILRDWLPRLGRAPWLGGYMSHKYGVLGRLSRCGTPEAGMVQFQCDRCGAKEWHPLRCQNRHCPGCGGGRAKEWAESRRSELMDVPYFQLVFPVPSALYPLFHENPRELYGLLIGAVQRTLKSLAADSEHLGGTPAFWVMLHTNNQQLGYHPHVHVHMAGATFNEATGRLAVAPDDKVLFPAEVLEEAFRTRFLAGLRTLADKGTLCFDRSTTEKFADRDVLETLLIGLETQPWKTWQGPAAGGPQGTIAYLGRYSHRTAITNGHITHYDGETVTFTWRDGSSRQRRSTKLPVTDFIRRFSRHILPKRFQRVRFYGLLSSSKRREVLPRAQAAAQVLARRLGFQQAVDCALQVAPQPPLCCQACGEGTLVAVVILRAGSNGVQRLRDPLDPNNRPMPPPRRPPPPRQGAT